MNKRMPADTFLYLQKNFPDEFEQISVLNIDIDRFDLFRGKKKKKRTNIDRYGDQLNEILEWLSENCEEPYFAKMNWAESRRSGNRFTSVSFYFMADTDAMAFKLMFQ